MVDFVASEGSEAPSKSNRKQQQLVCDGFIKFLASAANHSGKSGPESLDPLPRNVGDIHAASALQPPFQPNRGDVVAAGGGAGNGLVASAKDIEQF